MRRVQRAKGLREPTVIIVVMGVAGSGKTTVGELLATRVHATFLDGDAFHPPANIAKMSSGIPLTDEDRIPWLEAIHTRIFQAARQNEDAVVACSALKQKYRDLLQRDLAITWVFLKGAPELIHARLEARAQHYMKAEMLNSQLADLEEPRLAIVVDIALSPADAVEQIVAQLPTAGARQ